MERILNFIVSFAMLLMIGGEAGFYWKWKKRGNEALPLRLLIFLLFTADSLQDAFITSVCNDLKTQALFLPPGIAAAMPMSMQLLATAITALLNGRKLHQVDAAKNIRGGYLCSSAGFLICALAPYYYGILAGKILIGSGMGIVIVSSYGLAAMGRNEEEISRAFAGINAGTLGGIAAGSGIGSVILSRADYRTAYVVAFLIMLVSAVLAGCAKGVRIQRKDRKIGKMTTRRFVTGRKVLTFFLLMLFPFMIMIYYREYFFTLYAAEQGMSTANIGRILLLCGLFVIYAGPPLGEYLISRYGSRRTMFRADFLLFLSVAVFMVKPCLLTVTAGAVIMSVSISFAYTAQNTFFTSLPEFEAYGEGAAMGVYSMIENTGQMLGPVLFSAAVSLGYVFGIRLLGILYGISILLYLLLERKGNKNE